METTRVNKKADELTILVADDEGDIRDGAERILKRIGFRVLKAARGDEAQKTVEALRPDMVLLDLKIIDPEQHKAATGGGGGRYNQNTGHRRRAAGQKRRG